LFLGLENGSGAGERCWYGEWSRRERCMKIGMISIKS